MKSIRPIIRFLVEDKAYFDVVCRYIDEHPDASKEKLNSIIKHIK